MLNLIQTFCSDVRCFVDGKLDTATLVQENRKSYTTFKKNIRATAPLFIPYENMKRLDQLSVELFLVDGSKEIVPLTEQITLQQVRSTIQR